MNDKQIKFNFVSNEWVDQAEIILNDLVSRLVKKEFLSVSVKHSQMPLKKLILVVLPLGTFLLKGNLCVWVKVKQKKPM
ncbi:MAG: hypothetical protein CM1200mP12_02710 [Gammaproteobacteria bacterium]|nr:MAG: hypothetical protein CM1200mP12_02710 [Gammaproteobacteria bacterium]